MKGTSLNPKKNLQNIELALFFLFFNLGVFPLRSNLILAELDNTITIWQSYRVNVMLKDRRENPVPLSIEVGFFSKNSDWIFFIYFESYIVLGNRFPALAVAKPVNLWPNFWFFVIRFVRKAMWESTTWQGTSLLHSITLFEQFTFNLNKLEFVPIFW